MKTYLTFPFATLLLLAVSCSVDSPDKTDIRSSTPFLTLSTTVINADQSGNSVSVDVSTNVSWTLHSKPDWISVTPDRGNTDAELSITISQHHELSGRTGTIILQAESIQREITVNQSGMDESSDSTPIELVSYSESSIEMDAPLSMVFNKPIEVLFLGSGEETRILDFDLNDLEYFDNNQGVRFPSMGAELAKEISYRFVVRDQAGGTLQDTLRVKYYSQRLEVPALIRKAMLDEEGNLWILALKTFPSAAPSRMFKFKEVAGEFVEDLRFEIDVDYSRTGYVGGDFFINPYNDHIYIPDYADDQIEVYSKTGSQIKTINIEPVETDHPQNPRLSPVSIGFNSSGHGLVTLQGKGISGRRWRFINSANDDQLSDPGTDHPHFYTELNSYTLNQDQTALYAIEDRAAVIKVYSGGTAFDEIDLNGLFSGGEGAGASHLVQNRWNNKVYTSTLYRQQIFTPDGSYKSQQSFSRSFNGDFSYAPDHENYVYGFTYENTWIQLRDYDRAETVLQYKVNGQFNTSHNRGLLTTPDGEYVIIYSDFVDSSGQSSQIVFFKTEMFR